jgi:thiamine pyrophosphokinase
MNIAGVITGGLAPDLSRIKTLLDSCDLIVAADSGYHLAREWGISIDEVVGDFDSLAGGAEGPRSRGIPIASYSVDKEFSDTELALKRCAERSADRRILVGGGGGRIDHLLANVGLFTSSAAPDLWITGDSEIVSLTPGVHCFELAEGSVLSIMPCGAAGHRIRSSGLRWELGEIDWNIIPISLSNRNISSTITLTVERGIFLGILPFFGASLSIAPQLIGSWS